MSWFKGDIPQKKKFLLEFDNPSYSANSNHWDVTARGRYPGGSDIVWSKHWVKFKELEDYLKTFESIVEEWESFLYKNFGEAEYDIVEKFKYHK